MSTEPRVPEVAEIDLQCAPASGLLMRELNLVLPSDIRGRASREMARRLAGQGEPLSPQLPAPELSDDDRGAWGLIRLRMMMGECLPPIRPDEVEIARISLDSVTADRVSVRTRRVANRIAHSIGDEYDEDSNASRIRRRRSDRFPCASSSRRRTAPVSAAVW